MQRVKFLVLIFVTLFSIGISIAQDNNAIGSVLSMKQCVDIALKNNLQVQQSDISRQTNGVNFNQAKENLLPYIGASGSQGVSNGRSLNPYTYTYLNQQIGSGNYGISASLTLFSGLQLQNYIKQTAYAYDASKLDLEQQKQNITLSVVLAYLQVLNSQDVLDLSKKQAAVDSKQIERLEILNKEGALALLSNLSDLKGQYANDIVNIATTNNTLETAKINLFQLLNIPYKRDIQFEHNMPEIGSREPLTDADSIYAIALSRLPGIQSSELKIKSFEKGVEYSRGQYYPTLSLNGGINTNYSNAATVQIPGASSFVQSSDYVSYNGSTLNVFKQQQDFTTKNLSFGDQFKNNRYTSINLTLSVPILNYFRARNNVKQAKINLQNAEYNAHSTKMVLQQKVEQAYQDMLLAINQLKSYQDAVTAYSESFRTTEIRFNEGVIASDVYLLAKGKIDAANINLTIAKYNYIFRSKILDYYEGKLVW